MSDNISFTKIETHIDIPCLENPKPVGKYKFSKMKVGESIFMEGEKTGGKAYMAAQSCARYHSRRFVGRAADGGLRIWRVE